jgi:ADP-heptose:LPS heptosyltransferase
VDRSDEIDPKVNKTLVVRNDKLGDFMLAWPALALLKAHLPEDEIHVLVPEYTRELAELCPSVRRVIVDPGPRVGVMTLRSLLRDQRYRLLVTLFSTTRVGAAAWLARIPHRVAPATKIAQFFYNHRLLQRRSQSLRPEYEYNLELTRFALNRIGASVTIDPKPPYLAFSQKQISELKKAFVSAHNIGEQHRLIFVHPGSGGSARNLSLSQYRELITELCSYGGHWIIISAGPGELENAHKLSQGLNGINHVVYESKQGLVEFARHIAFADLFISGSTGPLHIAGALNRPTVGFYSRRRSATALRWQTLNQPERRLAFSPSPQAQEEEMASIDITQAAREISKVFLQSVLYP